MLANAFDTVRREKFAVIGVDDVHLVDHLSATLLHQLAIDGSVRLVATARTGEPMPGDHHRAVEGRLPHPPRRHSVHPKARR